MISILIPLYNGIQFIEECINSVKTQTFTKYEVLIGVNGHDINSAVYTQAKKFENNKIRVIHYNTIGKSCTLNKMLSDAQYEWIAILDVDDIWLPQKLETQIKYIDSYDVIGTQCKYFGEKTGFPSIPFGNISNFNFLQVNPIINSSALVKKKLCYWDGNECNDYDMWLRIWKNGFLFFNIYETLVHHRIHKNSYFNNTNHDFVYKLRNIWKQNINNNTTIVTGYFQIKSKHPHDKYVNWMRNLLEYVETNMVIFTDNESYNMICEIRKPYIKFTKIIITKFENFRCYKHFDSFVKHHNFDLQKAIHNPYLYMIWAEKSYFIESCIKENFFNSQYYFWCDIGSLRGLNDCPNHKKMKNWPYYNHENLPKNKIVIAKTGNWKLNEFTLNNDGIIQQDLQKYLHTVGGLFGGDKSALIQWIKEYDILLQKYINNHKFIGKDQSLYLNIIYKKPKIIKLIESNLESMNAKYFWIYDYFN